MKMDESRINRTLEAVRSTGAAVAISGYSLGGMKAIVDGARKKAFDDAMQNAQDYASTFGFSLGKVTALMSPRSPDVEIDPPVEAGVPYGAFGSYGISNRFWMEPSGGCPVIVRWDGSSIGWTSPLAWPMQMPTSEWSMSSPYILKGGRRKPLGYGRKNYRLLTCTSISK
jgi:hypothetical protein